jgi:hypothetical protein
MTQHPALFAALSTPFEPSEVKSRSQAGRQFHYVTARTVMNRLDSVLGPESWSDSYREPNDTSVVCTLTVTLPDGRVVSKSDAGGAAGMADAGDDDKSAYSDAFKRAAVKFGVGRYLYKDGVPSFARENLDVEKMPPGELPGGGGGDTVADIGAEQANRDRGAWAPTNGREFWAWLQKRDLEYPGLSKRVLRWAAAQKLPVKVIGWDPTVATRAYQATRKAIATMDRQRNGAVHEAEV